MEVYVLNRQRTFRVSCRALSDFVRRAAREVPPGGARGLTICLVSDRRMREYNRDFRGRNVTTDVLSFPAAGDPDPEGECYLGDIIVSVTRAAEQGRDAGHGLARELKILALHGYLHLLGHDHETDDGTMVRLQRRILRRLLPPSRGKRRARS